MVLYFRLQNKVPFKTPELAPSRPGTSRPRHGISDEPIFRSNLEDASARPQGAPVLPANAVTAPEAPSPAVEEGTSPSENLGTSNVNSLPARDTEMDDAEFSRNEHPDPFSAICTDDHDLLFDEIDHNGLRLREAELRGL